jgi:peptidoglycan/xylan/chitin deacetylase (PgdA/CDA1 family)
MVDGRSAPAKVRLHNGDVVVGENGPDIAEPVKVRTEAIPLAIKYEGDGPVETIVTTGSPGTRQVRYGSISGEVVSRRVVEEPVARVVARTVPASGAKLIALTFDDGPWPGQTAAVLKILQANHVPATFFQIGRQSRAHPGLSRMLTNSGMLIGNHSETHPLNLGKLSAAQVSSEITRAEADISAASGQRPKYFRPPGGNTAAAMYPVLGKLGLKWVQWDVDTEDWKAPPAAAIESRVLKGAKPGAVVLMHDGGGDRSHTIAALPGIIQKLKAKGYVFVTLDGLRRLPHVMG